MNGLFLLAALASVVTAVMSAGDGGFGGAWQAAGQFFVKNFKTDFYSCPNAFESIRIAIWGNAVRENVYGWYLCSRSDPTPKGTFGGFIAHLYVERCTEMVGTDCVARELQRETKVGTTQTYVNPYTGTRSCPTGYQKKFLADLELCHEWDDCLDEPVSIKAYACFNADKFESGVSPIGGFGTTESCPSGYHAEKVVQGWDGYGYACILTE